jgi:hypothetical protein
MDSLITLEKLVMKSMTHLTELEEGWFDGHGEKIDDVVVDLAYKMLISFTKNSIQTPAIGPTEEGGILFQWTNRSIILTLHSNEIELCTVHEDTVEWLDYSVNDVDQVIQKLTCLLQGES